MPDGDLRRYVVERRTYVWPPTSGNAYPRWVLELLLPIAVPATRWIDLFLAETTVLVGPVLCLSRPGSCYRWHGANASGSRDYLKVYRDYIWPREPPASCRGRGDRWHPAGGNRSQGLGVRELPSRVAQARPAGASLSGRPCLHRRVLRCRCRDEPTVLRVVCEDEEGLVARGTRSHPIQARRPVSRADGVPAQVPKLSTYREKAPRGTTRPNRATGAPLRDGL